MILVIVQDNSAKFRDAASTFTIIAECLWP